jgi:transcriptional regulator with XRE-family HTH domain
MAKQHLGQHVRALREAKAFTQEELAERSGLHRVYLAQLESGRNHNPRLDTLRRLAKALGVSVADLVIE